MLQMYIEPNSTLYVLKNVPLDKTYDHTLWFDSAGAQASYFIRAKKYEFDKLTYCRVQRGYMKVQRRAEDLYDCNYIMFQNTNFGTKWFYAFITGVEYVNNSTSQISFEIDVMQTWFFDYTLEQCFVEREHSATDEIGENTVAENLEIGPYITTATSTEVINDWRVWVLTTEIPDGYSEPPYTAPALISGFPNSCYTIPCGMLSQKTQTFDFIKKVVDTFAVSGKSDSIISIFLTPTNFNYYTDAETSSRKTISAAPRTMPITPRNKKLYTYPYCVNVSISGGEAMELRYELFDGDPAFEAIATFGPNSAVPVIAKNYAGEMYSYANAVSIKDFPLLPWIKDYYQNWLAQNRSQITMSIASNVTKGVLNVTQEVLRPSSTIAAGQAAVDTLSAIGSTLAKIEDSKVVPDSLVGSVNGNDALAFAGVKGFYNYCRTIKPEYIKIIDDYFTRFGYATRRLKIPNRNVRPHWTYTKTIGCTISGSCPADDEAMICRIYDNGITFWKNGSEVGNYSLDNSV